MKTLLISIFGLFLISCGTQKSLVGSQSKRTNISQATTHKKPLPPNTASNKYAAKRQIKQ